MPDRIPLKIGGDKTLPGGRPPQDCIHQAGRTRLPQTTYRLHRFVHHGISRDPIEETELVEAKPQDVGHQRRQSGQRPIQQRFQFGVQAQTQPEDTVDHFQKKGAIPPFGQPQLNPVHFPAQKQALDLQTLEKIESRQTRICLNTSGIPLNFGDP
jgi:hypothetical protein